MNVLGKLEPTKTEFRWKIENFSETMNSSVVGRCLYSPCFVTSWTNLESTKWRLKIYPGGNTEETKDHIDLFITYYGETDTTAICTLAASNESSETEFVRYNMGAHLFKYDSPWGYLNFLKKESITNKLVDDTLTITCVISASEPCEDDDDDKVSAFNYFEELLENKKFSDVTFAFGRKKISLHKAILTSISPVFQAMFEHDMKEKIESVVKITDIKITDDTTSLKTKVIEFIVNHIKELIDTPEYKQLDGECQYEIIKAVANKFVH